MDLQGWELGISGALVVVIWKMLDLGKQLFLEKRSNGSGGGVSKSPPMMTDLACQVDPLHFQHVKETHAMVKEWNSRIDRGEFTCAWQQHAVGDMLHNMKDLSKELHSIVAELKDMRRGGRI